MFDLFRGTKRHLPGQIDQELRQLKLCIGVESAFLAESSQWQLLTKQVHEKIIAEERFLGSVRALLKVHALHLCAELLRILLLNTTVLEHGRAYIGRRVGFDGLHRHNSDLVARDEAYLAVGSPARAWDTRSQAGVREP